MSDRTPAETNADLATLMEKHLGIRRGHDLATKLRHAGHLLPKAQRKAGQTLLEAERLWDNPKLRRQIDMEALVIAENRLRTHLTGIDPADRRKGAILGVVAPLAFNFLLIGIAVVAWLAWTGNY